MAAAPQEIEVLPSLRLLGWGARGEVAEVQFPHWESLALKLLLSFELGLLLLLLQSELIDLIVI
jgi:hypothetical protein